MCTRSLFTQLPLLGHWVKYTRIYLCAVFSHMVMFIILDSSKNSETKLTTEKRKKENECWYNDFVKKKKNLSSIQWEVWTASTEQQNAINVTYNIDVRWFHNIKNQGWSVIGLSVCWFVGMCTHDGERMCVCGWACYWGNASSFISMRGLSWLSMRRLGPIMLFLCLKDLDLLGEFGFLSDFRFLAFFSAP